MRFRTVLGLLSLFLVSTLHAHDIDYSLMKNEIGVDGGGIQGVSGNDFHDLVKGGNVFGVHYMHFVHPNFGLGAQLDYYKFDDFSTTSWTDIPDGLGGTISTSDNVSQKHHDISLMGTTRFNLLSRGLGIPYLIAGLGLNRFTSEIETTSRTYSNFGDSYFHAVDNKSSTGLCFALGAGLDMMISEVFRLGFEGRYSLMKQKVYKDSGDIELVTLKGRASWYFN